MKTNQENKALQIQEFNLYPKYIDMIKQGTKTTEGRIYSGRFKRLNANQIVRFVDKLDHDYNVLCQITGTGRYKNFHDMLSAEGYTTMIPDATTLEEAITVYNSIPSFQERAKRHGVIALRLKVLADQ
jgi:ASC-1-like (ASCH) protein